MKNNKTFLMIAVVVVVSFFGILAMWTSKSEQPVANAVTADESLLIKPHSLVKGNESANVTMVEFLDPECEACRAMHPIIKRLMSEYEGRIKLVIRYMPFHGNSKLAAVFLEEAREQGKFDAALDMLFERQPEWADHHHPRPELIPDFIAQVGIDRSKLNSSDLLEKHGWKVDLDQADGLSAGVRLTPTFFVNGVILNEIGYVPLKKAIETALGNSK